jgi:uncharacterized protein YggE
MLRFIIASALLLGTAAGCAAQTTARRSIVRALGDATLTSTPDVVHVGFAVETRAQTADEAASSNATRTAALLTALRGLLGARADIKTTGYSLNAIYTYPQGGTPVLAGYTATNSIDVTLTDLTQVGRVIDTGVQAGANRVQTLQFLLRDPEPVRAQALKQAVQKARAHAEAMAAGVNARLGPVIAIEEGGAVRVVSTDRMAGVAAGATTPIEPGSVNVYANVVVEFELLQ